MRPDSLLQRSPLCSLVVATAKRLEASIDTTLRGGVARAVCVTVSTFTIVELPDETSGDAYWTVEFGGPNGDGVGAQIDRRTGRLALRRFYNEFLASTTGIHRSSGVPFGVDLRRLT